jgi:hypothetical protein
MTTGSSGERRPDKREPRRQSSSIAFDSAGKLYIAEFVKNRVRCVDAKTGVITTIAENGLPKHGYVIR